MLNKAVTCISNKTGAVYTGILVGFKDNKNKFCISKIIIHSKVLGNINPKNGLTRWFRADKFTIELGT